MRERTFPTLAYSFAGLLAIITVIAIIVSSCAKKPNSPEPRRTQVRIYGAKGQVMDFVTKEPISQASVRMLIDGYILYAQSDSIGKFVAVNPCTLRVTEVSSSSTVMIWVTADGYEDYRYGLTSDGFSGSQPVSGPDTVVFVRDFGTIFLKPVQDSVLFRLDQPFMLWRGHHAVLQDGELTVTFRSVVSDSRCPLEMECFWEGMAEIQLEVEIAAQSSSLITLRIPGGAFNDDDDWSFDTLWHNDDNKWSLDTLGYNFRLLELYHITTTGGTGTRDAYIAMLRISQQDTTAHDSQLAVYDLKPGCDLYGKELCQQGPKTGPHGIFVWSASHNLTDGLTYSLFVGEDTLGGLPMIADALVDTLYQTAIPRINTTYFWKVRAATDKGDSCWSHLYKFQVEVITKDTTPHDSRLALYGLNPGCDLETVDSCKLDGKTPAHGIFVWSASHKATDILKYTLFMGEDTLSGLPMIADQLVDTFFQTAMPRIDKTYFWKVLARTDKGDSCWSHLYKFQVDISMSGGTCIYRDIIGKAKIVRFSTPAPNQYNCKYPVEIIFNFVPDDPISPYNYFIPDWPDNGQKVTTINGANPNRGWALSQMLIEGSTHRCVRREERYGSCTPVIFEFLDLDYESAYDSCFALPPKK